MANMYLMCGLSGCGKTTFSKDFADKYHLLRFGVDDYYAIINGDECIHENTFDVWIKLFKDIHDAESKGRDCIVDTNALSWHQRMQFIEWFPTFNHHLIVIESNENLRRKNNRSRRRQIPEQKMDEMLITWERPSIEKDTKWKSITYIWNENNNFGDPITVINQHN